MLEDAELGLAVQNSLKLMRIVEYYQWREVVQKGQAGNEYKKEWSAKIICSRTFKEPL